MKGEGKQLLCSYPIVLGKDRIHGCGQCQPCRINQSREWALRILLEKRVATQTMFTTLTYDDENLVKVLSKNDVQAFLKRLRKYGYKFRYYCCGEYGDKSGRPHYHLCIFLGLEHDLGAFRIDTDRAWSMGRTNVRPVKEKDNVASYISRYVTKKATKLWDPDRPEWHLSSRRPGLGTGAVKHICDSLWKYEYFNQVDDVPPVMVCDGKTYPIPQFLKKRMREYMEKEYGFICDPTTSQKICSERYADAFERFREEWLRSESELPGMYEDFGRFIADANEVRRYHTIRRSQGSKGVL